LGKGIRLAHLSDWHATTLIGGGSALLRPKRISGWASWLIGRRHRHSPAILAAAFRDLAQQQIDQILVTGDLTHVSLEQEFVAAAEQLHGLGPPERVFLIPGNHDCYVPIASASSWDHWAPYLHGDAPERLDGVLAEALAGPPGAGRAPRLEDYPTLRIRGSVALIGLCSAIPTPIFQASGRLGELQLARLETLLRRLDGLGLCRIVMVHHPVMDRGESARRAMRDRVALRECLARCGAELVVHGHKHRRRVGAISGPRGPVPVIGVPSASEVGSRPDKPAQYHVYTVHERAASEPFRIEAEIRGYDAAADRFRRVEERLFEDGVEGGGRSEADD